MRKYFLVSVLSMLGALAQTRAMNVAADSNGPAHHHGSSKKSEQGSFAFGKRSDPAKADRTVRITALDAMRYDKHRLTVRAGETVRFIVTNAGKIRHEFVLGDAAEQREHAQVMQNTHGATMHSHANGISLAPGETKTLVWQFTSPGTVEFACHESGHYVAGMMGGVSVQR